MRESVTGVLTLMAALGLVAYATYFAVVEADHARTPIEEKFESAERIVLYQVTRDSTPSLVLSRDERAIVLMTHAVWPASGMESGELTYGLRVRIRQPSGASVLDREIWTRTRRSRDRVEGDVFLDENTFTAEGARVGDDRLLELTLPPGIEDHALLDFRVLGETNEVLVRAYRRVELANVTADLRRFALSLEERNRLARMQGIAPWDALPVEEQSAHLQFGWERLSALGEAGIDFRTRAVFFSGFRAPLHRPREDAAETIGPHRALAYTIVGRATVQLELTGEAVRVRTLTDDGLERETVSEPSHDGEASRSVEISLGEGIHTLSVSSDGAARVRATMDGQLLEPSRRRASAYWLGPREEGVDMAIAGPDDVWTRTLRVDVRAIFLASDAPPEVDVPMQFEFLDAAGSVVHEAQVQPRVAASDYERVLGIGSEEVLVSEAAAVRFIVPRGVSRVRVRAEKDAIVRAFTLVPQEVELEPPFCNVRSPNLRWRFASWARRAWIPIRAHNHPELARASRVLELVGQTRLVNRGEMPRVSGDDREPAELAQVEPLGAPPRHRVLEFDRTEDAPGRSPYESYLDVTRPTLVSGGSRGETRLLYWVTERSDLRANLSIRLDERVLHNAPITVGRGELALTALPPGRHEFVIVGPPSLRAFANVSSAQRDRRELGRVRTIYSLRPSAPLRVRAPAGTRSLYVIAYARGREGRPDIELGVRVDGGTPLRLEGIPVESISTGHRMRPLPLASAESRPVVFLDREAADLIYPRAMRFVLGRDLAPRSHRVEIRMEGPRDDEIFVRVLVDAEVERRAVPVRHWRSRIPTVVMEMDDDEED